MVLFLILFDSEIAVSQKKHHSHNKHQKGHKHHKHHSKKNDGTLELVSVCSDSPNDICRWQVYNPNDYDIKVLWYLYGSKQKDIFTAKPGENFFETKTKQGHNVAVVKWKKKEKKNEHWKWGKWYTISEKASFEQCVDETLEFYLEGNEVLENKPSGTTIGILSSSDSLSQYEYELVEGEADNAKFTIIGDKLFSFTTFDYELQDTYSIVVKAINTDTGEEEEIEFEIFILDNKVRPYNIQLSSNSIEEFLPANTFVADITVLDSTENDVHEIAFAEVEESNENEFFNIVDNQLFTSKEFNYHEFPQAIIYLKATDAEGDTLVKSLTIDILNVLDPPLKIALSQLAFSEYATIGEVIAEISSTDRDSLDKHVYSIPELDTLPFTINENQLVLKEKVDFSSTPFFYFKLIATDLDGDTLSVNFRIEVINENVAPEDISLSNTAINELGGSGDFVSIINVVDQNLEDSHQLELLKGDEFFYISNDSLFTNRRFYNHEETSVSISLIATDPDGEAIEREFTIIINDVKDAPTALVLSSNKVDENLPAMTTVGTFSTIDENDRDVFTYKLISATSYDYGAFVIDGNRLLTSGSFNYHSKASYKVGVRVTDLAGDFYEKEFDIQVNNLIQAPTNIALVTANPIYENVEAPAFLGKIEVEDSDNSSKPQLEITASADKDDYQYFYLIGDSLFTNASFDFETQSSYVILVQATDEDNAVFAKEIQIDITDVNESGSGFFSETEDLQESNSVNVILEDFDNDGDNDALVANQGSQSSLWLNDGAGNFTLSSNSFETKPTFDIATADFDNDGDLDIVFANWNDYNTLWLNDGSGNFTKSLAFLGKNYGLSIIAQDIDGDSDKDIVVGSFNGVNTIWLNNGDATFTQSANSFSSSMTYAILSGDVDNDNDLDIVEIRSGGDQLVWINNGSGIFTQHAEIISTGLNLFNGVLSDLNNDGFVDLGLANPNGANEIWLNDGDGTFTNTNQLLGEENTYSLTTADLDTDGDNDLIFANRYDAVEIWFNDGNGNFENSMQQLNFEDTRKLAAAKIDDDADIDLFIISNDEYNHVWLNNSKPSGVQLVNNKIPENYPSSYFISTLTAMDIDTWDEHTFTLASGVVDNDNFYINNDSLFSNATFDYESRSRYNLEITVSDKQGATVVTPLKIYITDINEKPTFTITEKEVVQYDEESVDILISNINSGDDNYQNLSFAINSIFSDSSLIADAYFSYYSPNEYGYLHLDLKNTAFGSEQIEILLIDNGDTTLGGVNQSSQTFTIEIAEPVLSDVEFKFCEPDAINLQLTEFENYYWYHSLTADTSFYEGTSFNTLFQNDTTFYVTPISSNGEVASTRQLVSLSLIQKEAITPSLSGDILSVKEGYVSYQWYFNDILLSDETNADLVIVDSGYYYVEVTTDNGCLITSEKVNVDFTASVIEEVVISSYPNPADDYIQLSSEDIVLTGALIQIYDLSGELEISFVSEDDNPVVDLTALKTGFHIIHIIKDGEVYTERILKG